MHKVKSLLLSCCSRISTPCSLSQSSRKLRNPFVRNVTRLQPRVLAGNIKSWHRTCPQGLHTILYSWGYDQLLDVFSFACLHFGGLIPYSIHEYIEDYCTEWTRSAGYSTIVVGINQKLHRLIVLSLCLNSFIETSLGRLDWFTAWLSRPSSFCKHGISIAFGETFGTVCSYKFLVLCLHDSFSGPVVNAWNILKDLQGCSPAVP